ncbi:MAG: hypothetical protein V1926_04865 [Candidatus Peregrinibacteria bacterium]
METQTPIPILQWTAPIRSAPKRTKLWYVVMSIVFLLMLIFSVYTSAWTFTVVLILGTITYALVHRAGPVEKTIAILQEGVLFERDFTPWQQCTAFWILKYREHIELHIERKNRLKGDIQIQTGDRDPFRIREVLSAFLTEDFDRHENILDAFIRICKL